MIFLILAIVCFILLKVLNDNCVNAFWGVAVAFLGLAFAVCCLVFLLFASTEMSNIKESHITIAEQYKSSNQTEAEWEKTKEMLQKVNEKAKIAESEKVTYDEYQVEIKEDRVIFPEHYEVLDLTKDTPQETTEPTTEATYKETEIDGTKYQLVPVE